MLSRYLEKNCLWKLVVIVICRVWMSFPSICYFLHEYMIKYVDGFHDLFGSRCYIRMLLGIRLLKFCDVYINFG